jgi:hypothetical protein
MTPVGVTKPPCLTILRPCGSPNPFRAVPRVTMRARATRPQARGGEDVDAAVHVRIDATTDPSHISRRITSARGSPAHLQRVIGRVRAAPLLASAWPERGAGCAGTHSLRSERHDGERPVPTRDPSARTRVHRPATTPPDDIARAAASPLKWPVCAAGVSLTCLDEMADVDRRDGSRAPDDGSRARTRCLTSDPKKPAPARSLPSLVRGVWCASATGWVMRAGSIPRAASLDSSRAGSRCLSPRTRFLQLRYRSLRCTG